MVILINSRFVEIYTKPTGVPDHWRSKSIRIYDPLETIAEDEQNSIIQYLYDEGFIEDRTTDCEVVTGEDCNG